MAQLTPREKEALKHLLQGCTNKEIAEAMGITVVTAKLHVRSIVNKYGARNRTHAALLACGYLKEAQDITE